MLWQLHPSVCLSITLMHCFNPFTANRLLRLYTLPCLSNPLFLIFDILALWHSGPERPNVKNWLDQYGAECFQQQQFGTAGVEGVNCIETALLVVKQSPLLTEHFLSS